MTIAHQVYALWALLRPERIGFTHGTFFGPDLEIPRAKRAHVNAIAVWMFEDGSSLTRSFLRDGINAYKLEFP